MSLSDLYEEKNALHEANRELRQKLDEMDRSDREGRRDIYQTLEQNNRRIAELKAEIEPARSARSRDRQRLASLFEQKGALIEANKLIRQQIRGLHRDDREWRNDLLRTIDRNNAEISHIEAEIAEIRAS